MYGASGVRYGRPVKARDHAYSIAGALGKAAGHLMGRATDALDTETAKAENRRFREARHLSGNVALGQYSSGARRLYESLRLDNSTSNDSIRLIWVYGGANGQPRESYLRRAGAGLDCTLTNVSLSQRPSFVALSYTWGSEPADCLLRINKFEVPVTRSCYQALQYLPTGAPGYYIWIDQLCVDQSNAAEKSSQIQIMGRIYGQALGVIIWLGEISLPMADSQSESMVTDSSRSYSKVDATQLIEKLVSLDIKPLPFGEPADTLPIDESPLLAAASTWQGFQEMLSHPYFLRRWIIQEVGASQTAKLIYRGRAIEWNLLQEAVCRLSWMSNRSKNTFARSVPWDLFYSVYAKMYRSMDAILAIDKLRNHIKLSHEIDLVVLLDGFRDSALTDERDCFYALRSLCTSGNILPAPDYAASVRHVFEQHALFYIERGQGPRMLQCATMSKTREPTDAWPSWCPKWGFQYEDRLLRKPFFHLNTNDTAPFESVLWEKPLSAGGLIASDVRYIGQSRLQLSGRVVGKVTYLLDRDLGEDDVDRSVPFYYFLHQPYIDFVQKHASPAFLSPHAFHAFDDYRKTGSFKWDSMLHPEYNDKRDKFYQIEDRTGTPLDLKIWRQLENQYLTQGDFLDYYLTSFFKPNLDPGVVVSPNCQFNYPRSYSKRFGEFYARGRYLAVTEEGRLGLISSPARQGDLIVIFQGFAVPMILTPPSARPNLDHVLISDAYFLGWMQGEAFASSKVRLTNFVIR